MRIDAHMHFAPASYRAELRERSLSAFPLPAWSRRRALAFMDRQRIDTAVLSLSPPGVAFGDQPLGDHLARLVNDATAAEVASAPAGRFAGLAVLPLPDVDRALTVLRHALDVLGLAGVVLLSNVGGRYPGDAEWAPLLDELDRRGAYVLVHPTAPPYPAEQHPVWVYEFPFETTRAVASLISAGAGERWPRIRWQLAHLGGAVPFLAGRLAGLVDPAPALAFLRSLFYDTALVSGPDALCATSAFAGPDQIVLGSDWPYVDALDPRTHRYARNGAALLPPGTAPSAVAA